MSFGKVTTNAKRDCNEFKLSIATDHEAWSAKSPLIVSFSVPSWTLLLDDKAFVALELQSLPQNNKIFVPKLGLSLNVYETTLDNADNVFISQWPANLSGPRSMCAIAQASGSTFKT